jgi:hypothetical protein
MKLKISNQISLPIDAVTQTFAILAKRRAGKTYTGLVMAEEFVAAELPFIALDPLGAWWGLRSSDDGKSEGLPVVIIGGSHGDVPLEHTAGKVVADLVVDHPGYYIVDLSLTASNAEQDRFACDFAERLFRRKEQKRAPLHLFVDEADSFAPQRPMPGQQRMLGAFEALVRRGGIRGIGTTLITQRPAVLNKNVLTQTECMIVLQMPAPQDQDAVEDWVKGNGTDEQRKQFMESLASLQKGQAWVWSPSWLEVFKIVDIRRRRTFDSSATPKHGESKTPQKIARVDLEWLTGEIKATAERAKENDPQQLRKQIAELHHNNKTLFERSLSLERDLERLKDKPEVPALSKAQSVLLANIDENFMRWSQALEACQREGKEIAEQLKAVRKSLTIPMLVQPVLPETLEVWQKQMSHVQGRVIENGKIPKCEREILRALAQYPQGRSREQIAILTGYSVSSGGFANALATLRTADLITRTNPIGITDKGKTHVTDVSPLPTGHDLAKIWLNRLPKCEREILHYLMHLYPEGDSRENIAVNTHYSAQSGGFANALSKLRTLELITRTPPIKASDNFFQ